MNFARKKTPNDRIFTNSYFTFADLLRKSDIETPKGQNSHILRHTYASHFIMNGGNILTLQRILGHSDIKMTMRYAHLAPDHLRDAVTLGPMGKIEKTPPETKT
jgi:site-specific recombinase XerD